MLRNYDEIMAVTLPTLGAERQATYSPFLPLCPRTGRVLQVPITARDEDSSTVCYQDENGNSVEVPVTGGHCKLQWKADWAMRWHALGVDYEMAGKDLISSVELSGKICRILGSTPPEGFIYELFLDENGEKISKSRGNGLTIDEWLRYGSRESLSLYMFATPRRAKRLHFDVIPRHVDDYLSHLVKFPELDAAERMENPVWHIHAARPPTPEGGIGFAVLLNLVSVSNTEDPSVLWGFITRYAPDAALETMPILNNLVALAINYYRDFVKPDKHYRLPGKIETNALEDLVSTLQALADDASAEAIQSEVYEVGKRHDFEFKYDVGVDHGGRIEGIDLVMAMRSGNVADLSPGVLGRALCHGDNCYYLPNVRLSGFPCKTNTVSNTAFRGFGAPQGMLAIEVIIEHIARELGIDPRSLPTPAVIR